jgi:tryptophanyl-tRNA synthetase
VASTSVPRVFSGIQPSGELTLGTYLGALRRFVADQGTTTSIFCIVDLHAITVPQDPDALRRRTLDTAALYLASGIDPDASTLFVQSHVAEHAQLAWLMECTASFGELSRMTQFKEKSDQQRFVSAGLFTYPALMAADILLYDTDRVPVGDDQRQHLELTRDVAERFNSRHGATFVVPEADIPKVGARVMDLQEPTRKMSKSVESPQGTVLMADDPATIERKFKRAVTDNDAEVRFDPAQKPGVSNLLSILAAATGGDPTVLAEGYEQYGPLKADTAAAVIDLLRPIQARHAELVADPTALTELLAKGADRARAVAEVTLARAQAAVGLR